MHYAPWIPYATYHYVVETFYVGIYNSNNENALQNTFLKSCEINQKNMNNPSPR